MGAHCPPPELLLLLLALLGRISAAPSQGLPLSPPSCNAENQHYEATSQKCCYRCQPGYIAKKPCPTHPHSDCRKPCNPDYFLNREVQTPRCEACTSCNPARDLVEKAPCTTFSDRMCMCRPGMRCVDPLPNACALCVPVAPLTICKPGFGVKTGGDSDGEAGCEKCPPGTYSDQESSTEACKPHTDCSKLNKHTAQKGNSTHNELCEDRLLSLAALPSVAVRSTAASSILLDTVSASAVGMTTREHQDEFSTSHLGGILPVEKPSKKDDDDVPLVGASVLCFVVLFAALLILWQRRTCKKWIIPHKSEISNQAKFCAIRRPSLEEKGEGEGDLESLVESPDGSSLLETDAAPGLYPEGAAQGQTGSGVLVEAQHHSHTSNCIEKIYIMRADTVIVGSISEVPAGKICSAQDEEGGSGTQEEDKEWELGVHYPEQETEFCSASNVTTPVEEEWEFHTSSEKALAI